MSHDLLSLTWYEQTLVSGPVPRRRLWGPVLGLSALLVVLNLEGLSGHHTVTQLVLASTIVVVACIPMILWLSGWVKQTPFMALYCLAFTLYFGLAIFLMPYNAPGLTGRILPDVDVDKALALTLIGLGCLLAGYYGSRIIYRALPAPDLYWINPGNIKLWGIVFGCIGTVTFIIGHKLNPPLAIAQFVNAAAELGVIGSIMLFALQLIGRLDRLTKIFLWLVLIPIRVLAGLVTGFASQGIVVVLTLVFMYALLKHRLPWVTIALGVAGFLILRPAEVPFRALTWQGGNPAASNSFGLLQKAELMTSLIGQVAAEVPPSRMIEYAAGRFSDVMIFASVISRTPKEVPFWGGATYYPILFKPVPRLLYPGKPVETTGQDFGHRYGFIAPGDGITSVNLPQIIELYVNFGSSAVPLGMLALGLILGCIERIFFHPRVGFGGIVIGTVILSKLFGMESAASLVIGGIIWWLIIGALINVFIRTTEV